MPWAAAIPAAFSLGGGLLNLLNQQGQQGNQQQALMLAQLNYQLQQEQVRKQYELATAGREDIRGNRTHYVPGRGWVVDATPETENIVRASDANTRNNLVNQLTRGEGERGAAFDRRLREGSAADPLLDAFMYNYGAPTREGVAGKNAVMNVTKASEGADAIRSGYTGAALRTGQGTVPLASNMRSLDRGGTMGIRSALATSDAQADPLFQAQLQQFQQGKLNPYNTLATRAGNSSDVAFAPENISAPLDAGMSNAAQVGAFKGATGSDALYRGIVPLLGAYGAQQPVNYDTFISGTGSILEQLLKKFNFGSTSGSMPGAMQTYLSGSGRDPSYRGGGGF